MARRDHIIHLVRDKDRTKKACTGEPYTPPQSNPGDLLILCQLCNAGQWRK